MKLPAKRQKLALISALVLLVIIVAVTVVVLRRQTQQEKNQAGSNTNLTVSEQESKEVATQAQKYLAELDAANEKLYKRTEGIKTVAEFEERFKDSEREKFLILVLQRLEAEKNDNAALDFVTYIEAKYPQVAKTIDFQIRAYLVAKSLNRADLQAAYKQKVETTLREQGALGSGESLPDSYFNGEGQSD
ncbi:MAG: hypothetical protein V4702_05005 [Patescibacteria group bacterium]